MNNFGLYVHWPFCILKCPYCDFNSHKITNYDENDWLNAYIKQINYFHQYLPNNSIKKEKLSSIFFGGGTPSLMKPGFIRKIINHASQVFNFKENIEITLEANPSSLEFQSIKDFKNAGINRISLGVQSLNDNDLKFLGRIHKITDIKETLKIVLNTFDNVSVDLIYGLQNQKLNTWEKQLDQFLTEFKLQHISAYQLTIEKGTKFYKLYNENIFKSLSEKTQGLFYETTRNIIQNHKFYQYEVSNFAKSNFKSIHNQLYWKSDNWIGIGPGAVSRLWDTKFKRYQIENYKKPTSWLQNVLKHNKLKKIEVISHNISDHETLMMGLRLVEGIRVNKLYDPNIIKKNNVDNLFKKKILRIKNKKIHVNTKYLVTLDGIINQIICNH